jgi:hypothetical protein
MTADRRPRTRCGWFVALGILMILLGAFAWYDIIGLTLAGTIFIGTALLVGGVFQVVQAFMDRSWGGFLLQVLAGILYCIGGLLIMREPVGLTKADYGAGTCNTIRHTAAERGKERRRGLGGADAAHNQHSESRRPSDRDRIVTIGPSRFQPARPEVLR